MKIVDTCRITSRGEAIITDEAFTPRSFAFAHSKKKIKVAVEHGYLELDIIGAEAALKGGGREFLAFIVPFFADESTRHLITDREVELS